MEHIRFKCIIIKQKGLFFLMSFHLYIMRHAKSDWTVPGASDFDRRLTKRGEKNAKRIGQWMQENGQLPQKIISSSAVRAKQTTVLVTGELSVSQKKISYEKDLYLADPETLIEFIQHYKNDASSLMLVAHNPGLEQLTYFLSDSESKAEYRSMTTANLAIIEYLDNQFNPEIDKGKLIEFIKPKELD